MIGWSYTLEYQSLNPSAGQGLACLEIDLVTWDIRLPIRILRGPEAVAQRVRIRFRWFLGEWFLDTSQGVPYFRDVLIKNPDPILISFIFRQVLTTTPGVESVASFRATLDIPSRSLTIDFEAKLITGVILSAQAEPFIIG